MGQYHQHVRSAATNTQTDTQTDDTPVWAGLSARHGAAARVPRPERRLVNAGAESGRPDRALLAIRSLLHMVCSQPAGGGSSGISTHDASDASAATRARYLVTARPSAHRPPAASAP